MDFASTGSAFHQTLQKPKKFRNLRLRRNFWLVGILIMSFMFGQKTEANAQDGYKFQLIDNGNYSYSVQAVPNTSTNTFPTVVRRFGFTITLPPGLTITITDSREPLTIQTIPGAAIGQAGVDFQIIFDEFVPPTSLSAPVNNTPDHFVTFTVNGSPISGSIKLISNPDTSIPSFQSFMQADMIDNGLEEFTDVIPTNVVSVVGTSEFFFVPSDNTAPTFDAAPAASSITTGGFTVDASIDEAGDIYYVVLTDEATSPTSAEVLAGTGNAGAQAVVAGNSTNLTDPFTIANAVTGLSSGTDYDLYVVARDDEGNPNVQASPTKVDVKTLNTAPTFTSAAVTSVLDNQTYSYTPTATDADNDVLTFSATTKPSWLSFNTAGVTTLAGNGSNGDVDGTGTAAQFNASGGMVVDAQGNIFVAEQSNYKIKKITSEGVVSTFAGSGTLQSTDGTGTGASFDFMYALAIDNNDNLYVSERSRIRKITPSAVVTTIAGSGNEAYTDGTGTNADLGVVFGTMAVDQNNNVFFGQFLGHVIRKMTPGGVVTTIAGSGTAGTADGTGTSSAEFNLPREMVIDASGNLYVTENTGRIRKITPVGGEYVVSTLAGNGVNALQDGTGTGASFSFINGLTIDASNNLYVTDGTNDVIRKITPEGVVTTFLGQAGVGGFDNGALNTATFNAPGALTFDKEGNLFIADQNKKSIRKVSLKTALTGNAARQIGNHNVTLKVDDGNGGTAEQSFVVAVTAANVAPVVDLNGATAGLNTALNYDENAYINIAPSGTVSDSDNDNITSMTVTITNATQSFDDFQVDMDFQATAAKTAATNAGVTIGTMSNGVMNITGSATAQIYQDILQNLKYSNSSDVPPAETININMVVNDGTENSTTAISALTIIPFNDGSSAFGTGNDPTFTEGGNAVTLFSNMTGHTQEPNETITGFKFTITNVTSNAGADEKLTVDGTAIAFNNGNSGTTSGNSLSYSVALAGSTATVTLSGGTFTASAFGTLTEGVKYENINQNPANASRVVTLSEVTDSGAQGAGHDNPWATSHATSTVSVTPVNDPSVFTSATTANFAENGTGTAYTITATDVESSNFTYALGTGNDNDKFNITNNLVTFKTAPDFENPTDGDGNNTYVLEVKVTENGVTVNQNVTITVTDVQENVSPVFTSQPVTSILDNQIYSYTPTATDANNDALTITAPTKPSWLSLNSAPGNVVITVAGNSTIGSTNANGTQAQFNKPQDVAIDSQGNLYVSDLENYSIRKITPSGDVSVLAGGGKGQADGTGTAAAFRAPKGLVIDSQDNIYVGDTDSNTIRKITQDGVVTTFVGTIGSSGTTDGTGTDARFNNPDGLAIDGNDNIFATDWNNPGVIRKITPAGVVTSYPTTGFSQPLSVLGITTDSAGDIYLSDTGNNKIVKMSAADGSTSDFVSLGFDAHDMAFDQQGNLFISDGANAIYMRNTAGQVSLIAGGTTGSSNGTGSAASFNKPIGLSIDGEGNLYIAEADGHNIRKITAGSLKLEGDPSGQIGNHNVTLSVSDGNGGTAEQSFIVNVTDSNIAPTFTSTAVTSVLDNQTYSYSLIATDANNDDLTITAPTKPSWLTLISSSGNVVSTIAGSSSNGNTNANGTQAQFNKPQDVAVDSQGNLYVSDLENYSIRKITPSGDVSVLAGGGKGQADGTGTAAAFRAPKGLVIDSQDNIYVGDTDSNTIRKITQDGVVTTFVGTIGSSGTTDGTGTDARFNNPDGLAIDGNDNIFATDWNNPGVIRKITPAGVVTSYPTTGFSQPLSVLGITTDAAGDIYLSDTGNNKIVKMSATDGSTSDFVSLGFDAHDMAFDQKGNLFISDGANAIYMRNTAGQVSLLAGGTTGSSNGTGSAASFNTPIGLTTDSEGNLYIAESEGHNIRKITAGSLKLEGDASGQVGDHNVTLSVSDGNGGTAEQSFTISVTDGTPPTVTNVTFPADGYYKEGDDLVFSVEFSETVILGGSSGSAVIILPSFDGSTAIADYESGSGSTTLVFKHTVQSGEYNPGDFTLGSIEFFSGDRTIKDATGNDATYPQSLGSAPNLFVDATLPVFTSSTTGSFAENGTGTAYSITATDNSSITYTLGTGNDEALFNINAGVITFLAAPNFETPSDLNTDNDYVINVIATDAAGNAANQNVTITVTGVNEFDPVISSSPVTTVNDNATYTYVFETSDGDNDDLTITTPTKPSWLEIKSVPETTTFAGGSFGSADGTGTDAQFNNPYSIAIDKADNIYVVEFALGIIRKITSAGVVSTFIGNDGSFDAPVTITIDSNDNLYVADWNTDRIRKITPDGVVSTFAGSGSGYADGTGTQAKFHNPYGMDADASGNIYVADYGNQRIRKITPEGVVTTIAGSTRGDTDGTGTNAQFSDPYAVVVDASDNLFVSDAGNFKIKKITPAGVVSTFVGSTSGDLDGTGTNAEIAGVLALEIDAAGNLYLADVITKKIRKVDPSGVVETYVGSGERGHTDGVGSEVSFDQVSGLAFDSSGNLFAADRFGKRIRKVSERRVLSGDATGQPVGPQNVSLIANDGGDTPAIQNFIINIVDATAPVFTSATTANFAENGTGTVYTAVATDINNTVNYSLGTGNDEGKFNLQGAVLTFITAPDFENPSDVDSDNTYSVNIIATDGTNNSASQTVIVTVTNVNEPPVFNSNPITDVREGEAYNYEIEATYDGDQFNLTAPTLPTWLTFTAGSTQANTVSTFAGGGSTANADGTGTAAAFSNISAMTSDSDGNVYVANSGNNTIRKITPTGVVTTLANNVANVVALAADGNGNVFSAEASKINKITQAGVVTTFIGSGIVSLTDMVIDSRGTLYWTDLNSGLGRLSQAFTNGSFSIGEVSVIHTQTAAGPTPAPPPVPGPPPSGCAPNPPPSPGTPRVSSVNSVTPGGAKAVGDVIEIKVNFYEAVNVTGTPQLTLETGDTDRTIDYSGGSGSTTLIFNYTIQLGDKFKDLNYVDTNSLTLGNGGSIKSAIITSNDAVLTLPCLTTGGALAFTTNFSVGHPVVTNVSSTTADGTKKEGETVEITVTFSEPVNVTGTPKLKLETGSTDQSISYNSTGSGTNTLSFSYTVQEGDNSTDLDYQSASALTLEGGTLKDADGDDAIITLPTPGSTGSLAANKSLVIDAIFEFNSPSALAIDKDHNLFVVVDGTDIVKFDAIYAPLAPIDPNVPPAAPAPLVAPTTNVDFSGFAQFDSSLGRIAIGKDGLLYAFETGTFKLQQFDTNGTATVFAGSGSGSRADGVGTAATFTDIKGLAIDQNGNLYAAESDYIRQIKKEIAALKGTAPAAPGTHNVVLKADDSNGGTAEQSFTITVNDVTDPVFTSGAAVNFAENGTGTAYTIIATDANPLTYSLGTGNDESLFNIDGTSGAVTFKTSPDYESASDGNTDNAYVINVIASDGVNTSNQDVTITVTDVNDVSPVITSTTSVNYAENGQGTAYTVTATDVDSQNLTYSFGTGNDEALFNISGGVVTFKSAPDFETPGDEDTNNTYVINVIASDGVNTSNQDVTITVTDVNDVSPVITSATSVNYAENGQGTAYTVTATDVDSQNLTYSFGTGNDEALFNISGGVVTFKTSPDYESASDANTDNAYVINVIASDGVNTSNQDVTITVTNVNDVTPVLTSATSVNYAENGQGTAYTVTATDVDSQNLTYSFGTGNDESLFDINGGAVIFKTSPDFEVPKDANSDNTYMVEVTANDGLNEAKQIVTITVTDLDEISPKISALLPVDGATVPANALLHVTFDEPVVKGTGKIRVLRKSDSFQFMELDVTDAGVTVNNNIVSIDFPSNLPAGEELSIVPGGTSFTDAAGNDIAGLFTLETWNLTATSVDVTPPTIVSLSPSDGSTGVESTANLVATFNEPVVKGTGNIKIARKSDNLLITQFDINGPSVTISGNVVTIDPPIDMPVGVELMVKLPGSSLTDVSGNNIAGLFNTGTWNFTAVDITPPSIVSLSPVDGAADISPSNNLVVTFNEPMLKGTGNIKIGKKSDNSLITQIDVTSPSVTISGNVVTIDPPIDMPVGVELMVKLPGSSLTDVSGNNIAGLFNTGTWNFTAVDITPPSIVSLSPVDGAADISPSNNLVVTFNEPMLKGTGNIKIGKKSDNSLITQIDVTSPSVTISGNVVTIDPPIDMPVGVELMVKLPGSSLTDVSGNNIAGLFNTGTWNFTASDLAPTASPSVFVDVLDSKDKKSVDVKIYPNPSQGLFTVDLSGLEGVKSLQIYDFSGRAIRTITEINEEEVRVDLSDRSGVYLVNVNTTSGIVRKRVVIKK